MKTEICTKCGKDLLLDNYHYSKIEQRFFSECKVCYRLRCYEYRKKNKDKIDAYLKNNYEAIKERGRKFKHSPAKFKTYSHQISFCDETRKDPNNSKFLQVKCKHCKKWFNPSVNMCLKRIRALDNKIEGEHNFYCSQNCKINCPLFGQVMYPKTFKKTQEKRGTQSELRELILERDNFKCIKCDSQNNLICHHIEGVLWEPLESADMDKCITVCEECHNKIHSILGCGRHDMVCKN